MGILRDLPSVDQLLNGQRGRIFLTEYGHKLTVSAVRDVLEMVRNDYSQTGHIPEQVELEQAIGQRLEEWTAPTLDSVINAAGVILHTNLGRAPLSQFALAEAQRVAQGYSSLEFDLERGKRGSRLIHAEALLQRLTGVEAALVVNNNAAAVLLALTALARRRAVVIARSQLVEIGGGFRVPDVMKQSGARLVEVGTTNRVHLRDYEQALEEKPALFLRAHRSNFQIVGFTSEPELRDIVQVAHQAGIPVMDDLGSGSLLDTEPYGLGHEPMVQEVLAAGVDLVCFSGDKLLGGPQAGIIVGRADLVAKIKRHPLARAVRADKLCLAALSATLLHYLKEEAVENIPVWRMISATQESLEQRARDWVRVLRQGKVQVGESTVGGGSLPGETVSTWLVAFAHRNPDRLLAALRKGHPPVVARVEAGRVVLDPRTVLPEQDERLLEILAGALDKVG